MAGREWPTSRAPAMGRAEFLRTSGAALGGLALFGLSGCGGGQSGGGSRGYTGEVPVAQLATVVAGAAFYTAAKKGYFTDEKLKLKLIDGGGGTGVIQAMRSPNAKFGMIPATGVITAFARGSSNLRIISGFARGSIITFAVLPDSPLSSPEDLRPGMKIGVSEPASVTTLHARALLKRLGLSKKVEVVFVGDPAEAATALRNKLVDVSWSPIPLAIKQEADGDIRILVKGPEIITDWLDGVLVTTQEFLDDQPETLRNWMAALQRVIDLTASDVDEVGKTWAGAIRLDPSVTTEALRQVSKDEPYFDLALDMAAIEKAAGFAEALAADSGGFANKPDLKTLVTTELQS